MGFWKKNCKIFAHYELDLEKFSPTTNRAYLPTSSSQFGHSKYFAHRPLKNLPTTKHASKIIRPLGRIPPRPHRINNEASLKTHINTYIGEITDWMNLAPDRICWNICSRIFWQNISRIFWQMLEPRTGYLQYLAILRTFYPLLYDHNVRYTRK